MTTSSIASASPSSPPRAGRAVWAAAGLLGVVFLLGLAAWLHQLDQGLGVTGLSRQGPWGLYIGQFTFLVGVAASAVMVVLPFTLHGYAPFARWTSLGEALSLCALVMAMAFIAVDLGRPARLLNIVLYPSPRSMMFWDMVALGGYLCINLALWLKALRVNRAGGGAAHAGPWRALAILSIPWAFTIHTVTAMLYSGLAARPAWETAILAPRFLASAFACGPSLLILIALVLRAGGWFDPERAAISKLAQIATYALVANAFFAALEVFTSLSAGGPEEGEHFAYLYGLSDAASPLAPWAWIAAVLAVAVPLVMLFPAARRRDGVLAGCCAAALVALALDKGLCFIVGGYVPSSLGEVVAYRPTLVELAICCGIWAAGSLAFLATCRATLASHAARATG